MNDEEYAAMRRQVAQEIEDEIASGARIASGVCRGMKRSLYDKLVAEQKAKSDLMNEAAVKYGRRP